MTFTISNDVLRLIELVAALATILGCMVAVFTRFFRRSTDPYLPNYAIAAFVFVICSWLTLRFPQGVMQVRAVQVLFGAAALIALGIVCWRGLEAKAYATDEAHPLPVGFAHQPNKTPYSVLLGTVLIALLLLFFIYSSVPENHGNIWPLLLSFLVLVAWFMVCRLVWQYFDNWILAVRSRRTSRI